MGLRPGALVRTLPKEREEPSCAEPIDPERDIDQYAVDPPWQDDLRAGRGVGSRETLIALLRYTARVQSSPGRGGRSLGGDERCWFHGSATEMFSLGRPSRASPTRLPRSSLKALQSPDSSVALNAARG